MKRCTSILLSLLGLVALAGPRAVAADFDVDPVHSAVVFKVNHLGFVDFYGRFDAVSGGFSLDGSSGSVQVEIETASVDTGNEQRDKHLRGPDFLNAAQFPVATFRSTRAARTAEGTWEVEGKLELHGVTRQVSMMLTQGRTAEVRGTTRTGFNGTLTIQRSDFGMGFMIEGPGIGDEVTLLLAIEGVQQ